MRLFLCLAAVLVATLAAERDGLRDATHYQLPGGFPDGAILTFYFWHKGEGAQGKGQEWVGFDFYDLPKVPIGKEYDINAHLRIDRDLSIPVESNTFINGSWQTADRSEQPLDEIPPSNGWWRVDVIKFDNYHLNVFFQGFFSGLRKFERPLDNIQSIYLTSNYVDHKYNMMHLQVPKAGPVPNTLVTNYTRITGDDKRLVAFADFPIGAHITMVVILKASGEHKDNTPWLGFGPASDPSAYFMKIGQRWTGTEELLISSGREDVANAEGTKCFSGKPNGNLLHLDLARLDQRKFRLQVLYKNGSAEGITCVFLLPDDLSKKMDEPFDIWGNHGAFFYHFDYSIPSKIEVKKTFEGKRN